MSFQDLRGFLVPDDNRQKNVQIRHIIHRGNWYAFS